MVNLRKTIPVIVFDDERYGIPMELLITMEHDNGRC